MTAGSLRITTIEGRAVPLRGSDIDTDRIIPARYLRAISFEGMERHVFEDDRQTTAHPFDDPRFAGARILVVNQNFGCGSSREHAPQALSRWGIRVIVGESFSDIFFGNAVMIGMPCVTAARADVEALMQAIEDHPASSVRVDLARMACEVDGTSFAVTMPAHARDAFVSGAWDTTGLLLEHYDEVRAVADRLPYLTGFSGQSRPEPVPPPHSKV